MKKNMVHQISFPIVVAILFLQLGGNSPIGRITSSGTTLYVGGSGPGNYTSIQEAIYNATGGDTVFVYDDSSPYFEHVTVNKAIKLLGENAETTVIDGNSSGNVVYITSDLVTVSGFTITHGMNGVLLNSRTTNVTLSRNIITENTLTGINCSGFCEHNQITENIISFNRNGTYMSAGSYNEIYGNTFSNNELYGLVLMMWCNENEIHSNNFIKNKINAFFFLSALNKWGHNYWDRPRILPKPILGLMGILPWLNFDYRPLLLPYTIPSE
jgi:parallel beta-helix repeat protein